MVTLDVKEEVNRTLLEQIDLELELNLLIAHSTQARLNYALLLYTFIRDNEADPVNFPENEAENNVISTSNALDRLTNILVPPQPLVPTLFPTSFDTHRPQRNSKLAKPRKGNLQDSPLYVQTRFTGRRVVAKLSCRDCGRFNFPSIQGLLNHCRISHFREFTGHDALVEACGEIIPSDEGETLILSGADIKTVNLPSLRTLFEQAVLSTVSGSPDARNDATFLTRTLGWHKDSPSLASFLGSSSKKRSIKSVDCVANIDIEKFESDDLNSNRRYSRRFHNVNTEFIDPVPQCTNPVHELRSDSFKSSQNDGSRFHLKRRVVISDHSQLSNNAMASWSILVTSPVYSKHISTFLKCMEVTCITQPAVFDGTLRVSDPPFICGGNSVRPFLAKVRLIWSGSETSPAEVEHWVDLHPSKTAKAALGEEQIVDIDLDRAATELPLRVDNFTVAEFHRSSLSSRQLQRQEDEKQETAQQEKDLSFYLRKLVLEYPLTARDSKKRRHPPRLPYPLLPTPEHLHSTTIGRRKAIEWARSRAIRNACVDLEINGLETGTLGVGTIFRWINENACCDTVQVYSVDNCEQSISGGQELFCSSCGINAVLHRKSPSSESTASGVTCGNAISRLPLVDVNWWVKRQRLFGYWGIHTLQTGDNREFVEACEPSLLALAGVIMKKVKKSITLDSWESMAGIGLAGLLMEVYIRNLTQVSVVILRDIIRQGGPQQDGNQCLTRNHIFRALLQGAFKGGLPDAIFTCSAEIGSGSTGIGEV